MNVYVIRHIESGKYLSNKSNISFCGKAYFQNTNKKFFSSLEKAKQTRELLGLCFAGLSEDDLEIVDTKNNYDEETWEVLPL